MNNKEKLIEVFTKVYTEEYEAMNELMAQYKADPTIENIRALKVMMDNVENTQKVLTKLLGIES